jgi:opacity protein-like surface antigen
MLRRSASLGALLMVVTLAAAKPSAAQARLTGGFAAGFGSDQVAPSGFVSLGYDVKPNFGLEVEFGVTSGLGRTMNVPVILDVTPLVYPSPEFSGDTRIISFSANAVGRMGAPEHKVSPYVVVGGGLANVEREIGFIRFPDFRSLIPDNGPIDISAISPLLPYPTFSEFTENAFMATVGGGLDIDIASRMAAGVDVRYQHVFSDRSSNGIGVLRVGGRFTFKF